jgi:hypothetical protein
MMRWLWWGLAFYALGGVTELILEAATLSTFFYAAGSLCVPFNVAIAAAWIGLKGTHGPV